MNSLFNRLIDENVPKFNKTVVDGMVKEELKKMANFIDTIFRSSVRSFTKDINVTYEGYRFVSPEEEFNKNYVKSSSKQSFDLAHSDVYPVCFLFKYNNEPIEKVLLLPYAKKGNLMMISGSEKVINPVLSDSVISPSEHQVFVRLYKDKIIFKSEPHNFLDDDEVRTSNVCWVVILKDEVVGSGLGDASIPPASLYLLGRACFRGSVEEYFTKEMQRVGGPKFKKEHVILGCGDYSEYSKDYRIYKSMGVKPSRLNITDTYNPNSVFIAVHRSLPETSFTKNFIFGIIYAFDILPDRVEHVVKAYNSENFNVEQLEWRIILGIITYRGTKTITKVIDDTRDLFVALQNYVDGTIIKRLATVGIYIDSFWDLVYEILKRYDEWSLKAKEYNMDVNNRYLDVLYYMSYPFIEKINRTIYAINKRFKKTKQQNKSITFNEVYNIFKDEMRQTIIYNIVKSDAPHFNIKLAGTFNSSVYLSCSCMIEDQGCAKGVVAATDGRMPIYAKNLNPYAIYFGSVAFITKSKQSINFKVNPFLDVDTDTGKLVFEGKTLENIKEVSRMLINVVDEEHREDYDELVIESDDTKVN